MYCIVKNTHIHTHTDTHIISMMANCQLNSVSVHPSVAKRQLSGITGTGFFYRPDTLNNKWSK